MEDATITVPTNEGGRVIVACFLLFKVIVSDLPYLLFELVGRSCWQTGNDLAQDVLQRTSRPAVAVSSIICVLLTWFGLACTTDSHDLLRAFLSMPLLWLVLGLVVSLVVYTCKFQEDKRAGDEFLEGCCCYLLYSVSLFMLFVVLHVVTFGVFSLPIWVWYTTTAVQLVQKMVTDGPGWIYLNLVVSQERCPPQSASIGERVSEGEPETVSAHNKNE